MCKAEVTVPTCHRQRHRAKLSGRIVHIHAVALEQQVHVGAAEVIHRVPEVEGATPAPVLSRQQHVVSRQLHAILALPPHTLLMRWQCGAAAAKRSTCCIPEPAAERGKVPRPGVMGTQPQVAVDAAAADVHGQLDEPLHHGRMQVLACTRQAHPFSSSMTPADWLLSCCSCPEHPAGRRKNV
jgi:hypothetical protein